jgi:hypothetical protein
MKKDNFEIKIEGLKYGSYSKELNDIDYRTAVKIYCETQQKFKGIDCDVILYRVSIDSETGKKTRKLEYKNHIGQNTIIDNKLRQVLKIFKEIEDIKQFHRETSYTGTNEFNDVRHVIELGHTNDLSPEECKKIFNSIRDKALVRRHSKSEYELIKEINDEFGHIQIKTKNVLDKCRKIRHNSKTAKAINNAAVADEKYKNTLQLLLKEYI